MLGRATSRIIAYRRSSTQRKVLIRFLTYVTTWTQKEEEMRINGRIVEGKAK